MRDVSGAHLSERNGSAPAERPQEAKPLLGSGEHFLKARAFWSMASKQSLARDLEPSSII